ncbi:MAG: zf-HC2 domain-containing protein [Gemmatimonadetes bacterium]|nr:zf-HC2 domain-containing protein [Gemmatimonadota bacterium]
MNGKECEKVRDLLPDWARKTDRADGGLVEDHLRTCAECERELEVILAIRDQRPAVPAGLEAKIQARVRQGLGEAPSADPAAAERAGRSGRAALARRRWAPAWALSAAAVVVLALGTSLIWNGGNPELVQDPAAVASQEPLPESWLWDDGMIAGAPVFDGLSDEDLETLLEELEG